MMIYRYSMGENSYSMGINKQILGFQWDFNYQQKFTIDVFGISMGIMATNHCNNQ
jgi:hypothetical protein